MYKRIILLILLLVPMISSAQRWKRFRYEVVYGIGATNFLGELGGANQIGTDYFRDLEISMTRYVLNIGMRYKLSQYTSVKTGISYGRLRGHDNTTEEPARKNRNLHFRSPLIEWSTQYEFSWMKETIKSRYKIRRVRGRGKKGSEIYFYGFVGFSTFWFNPKAQLGGSGKWHALKPLHTEGQGLEEYPTRKNYSRFQVAIPAGIGIKYNIDKSSSIGIEYGLRKTFTDYIDDVSKSYIDKEVLAAEFGDLSAALSDQSLAPAPPGVDGRQTYPNQQRGDPTDNDAYMFLLITYNYKLQTTRKGLPKF